MELILQKILNNIELVSAIVMALSALAVIAITQYHKIKKLLAAGELNKFIAPYIAIAESEPHKIFESLNKVPEIASGVTLLKGNAGTNDSKALLVAQASIEAAKKRKPSILKTLGINSAADVVPIVSGLYGLIKPSIKKK